MQNREIRVFLSSTFNDMHPERDWLVRHTFPKLRQMAAERGVALTEVDLRWGITEKEAKEGKTISICLEEIINSRPFFIGLLGNRYGWAPTVEELGEGAIPERFGWIADDLNKGLSITEIEMQYGVLRNPNDLFASFFIREGGADDDPRQTRLKETVRTQERYPVDDYSSPEQLGELIESRFSQILDSLYPAETYDEAEAARINQLIWARNATRNYLPDPRSLQIADEILTEAKPLKVLIGGASGSGKSALLAYIAAREANNDKYHVVAHFPAIAPQSGSEEVAEFIRRESAEIPDGKQLLIIVDDAAAITDNADKPDLSWIDAVPEDAILLVSVADSQGIAETLKSKTDTSLTVMPLLLSQRRKLADNYFKSFSKHLEENDLEIIGSPSKVTDNTLAYVTMLEELRCFGSFDRLPEYIGTISNFTSYIDFYDFLLSEKESFYATQRHPDVTRKILSLLYLSADGLTEHELAEISGIPPMHISHFVLGNTYLIKRNKDRLYIAHSHIEDVISKKYLDDDYVATLRDAIISYFEDSDTDPARRDTELPYQYWMAGDDDNLYLYISRIGYLKQCLDKGNLFFLRYWDTLLNVAPDLYPVDAYLDTIPVPSPDDSEEAYGGPMALQFWNEMYLAMFSPALLRFVYLLTSHLGNYEVVRSLTAKAILMLGKNGNPEWRQAWLSFAATIDSHTGHYAKALRTFESALECLPDSDMADQHTIIGNIAETYLTIAENTRDKHFLERAIELQRLVLDFRREQFGPVHTETAVAMSNLASSLNEAGRLEEARKLSEESARIYAALNGDIDMDVAISLNTQGYSALENGNYEEALAIGKRIEKILLELGGPDNAHLPDALLLQAGALSSLHRNEDTEEVLRRMLSFLRRNPEAAAEKNLLNRMADYAYAARQNATAIEITDLILETENFDSRGKAYALNLKGKALADSGHIEESIRAYDEAVAIYTDEGDYRNAVEAIGAAARAFSLAGKLELGAEWFGRGFEMAEEYNVGSTEKTPFIWQNYAVTLYNLDRLDEAADAMRHACETRQDLFGEEDEMLNEEYIPLYNQLVDKSAMQSLAEKINSQSVSEETDAQSFTDQITSLSLNEEPVSDVSRNADVEVFRHYTDNEEYIRDYIEAARYFSKGSMSHAANLFTRLRTTLRDNDAAPELIAWVTRGIAFSHELLKTEEGVSLAENEYQTALGMALEINDPKLIENIAHDYAEFFWNEGNYNAAFQIYTYQLYGCVRQYGLTGHPSMSCLGNMASAIFNDSDPEIELSFHLGVLLMVLSEIAEDEEINEWASNIIGKAAKLLKIDLNEFEPDVPESIATVIDYLVDYNLYYGAEAVGSAYRILPDDMFTEHDIFRHTLAMSYLATPNDPAEAYRIAMNALNFAEAHPDAIDQYGLDRLYHQLAKMSMRHALFHDAEEWLSRLEDETGDSEELIEICEAVNSNGTIDIDSLDEDNPADTIPLILALQNGGAETEANELFMRLAGTTFDNPYSDLLRLYAIVSYLRAAKLNDEAVIYKNLAFEKIENLTEIPRQLFIKAFRSL